MFSNSSFWEDFWQAYIKFPMLKFVLWMFLQIMQLGPQLKQTWTTLTQGSFVHYIGKFCSRFSGEKIFEQSFIKFSLLKLSQQLFLQIRQGASPLEILENIYIETIYIHLLFDIFEKLWWTESSNILVKMKCHILLLLRISQKCENMVFRK